MNQLALASIASVAEIFRTLGLKKEAYEACLHSSLSHQHLQLSVSSAVLHHVYCRQVSTAMNTDWFKETCSLIMLSGFSISFFLSAWIVVYSISVYPLC